MMRKTTLIAAGLTGALFAATAFALVPGQHPGFEQFDLDRDGVFSAAEIERASAQIFERVDTNRDGRLDVAEAGAMHGRPGRGGALDADADRDGAVTLAEFRADIGRHIATADTNRDGQLSIAEIEAMHRRATTVPR